MSLNSRNKSFQEMTGHIHYNPVIHFEIQGEHTPRNLQALEWCREGAELFAANISQAYAYFELAQRLCLSISGVFYALAICHARFGNPEAATKMLRQELKNRNPHPNAHMLLQDIEKRFRLENEPKQPLQNKRDEAGITIFALPKAFCGHNGVIQRNAIKSWTLLDPRPEIILFGNEKGTAEIARELGLRHIPQVKCNEHSTPMVDDLFFRGQDAATCPIVAYINADIILMSDFLPAIHQAAGRFSSFFMIGRRWDLDVSSSIDFSDPGWEKRFRDHILSAGKLHEATGIDYFVFTRGLWQSIPPFAIGRTSWDNWFVYQALKQESPVIDATEAVFIIHQNHGYEHVRGGEHETWNGAEAKRNLALLGGYENVRTVEHATWKFTDSGIEKPGSVRAPHVAAETHLPLRLMQVETFYPHMLNFLYSADPQLSQRSSDDQVKAVLGHGLNAVHVLAPFIQELGGYETRFVAANCIHAQMKWAQENGLSLSTQGNWLHDIVRAQIESYKPDVLYTTDPVTFDSRFIRSLGWKPDLIVAWHASDIPPATDWSEIDVIVSPLAGLRQAALERGAGSAEQFMPGFPGWIYEHIKDIRPQFDVVFCGQWSIGQHARRNQYLQHLALAASQKPPRFSCAFYLSGEVDTIGPEVARFNRGQRYGIPMYEALRSGKIALDARGSIRSLTSGGTAKRATQDVAGTETANMRIFEATGSGVFLLTELHENLSRLFEIGKEIETFRDENELVDKIAYYATHEDEREAIARAGHERCLQDHSMQNRARDLDRIIRSHVSKPGEKPLAAANLNRTTKAVQEARRVLSLDPTNSEAIDVLFQVSDFDEARQAFSRSVIRTSRSSPPRPWTPSSAGEENAEATAMARGAMELAQDPKNFEPLKLLAQDTLGKPFLEYAPAGWQTVLENQSKSGWNSLKAVASEIAKWEEFRRNVQGTGPLGFSHEHTDLSVVREVPFHNVHITFAYVLAAAAHMRRNLSVLDWGGGLGHYYLLGKAVMPATALDYHINEVPVMAEAGKLLNPDVNWYSDERSLERPYDLVMINGSLQYMQDWKNFLRRISRAVSVGGYLFLTRLPVVDHSPGFVAIQRAYGMEMLHQQLNAKEVLSTVRSTGLRLVREFVVGDRPFVQNAPEQCELRGWLFERE